MTRSGQKKTKKGDEPCPADLVRAAFVRRTTPRAFRSFRTREATRFRRLHLFRHLPYPRRRPMTRREDRRSRPSGPNTGTGETLRREARGVRRKRPKNLLPTNPKLDAFVRWERAPDAARSNTRRESSP